MRSFWRCLWSESLKLKRSLALWLAVIAPLVIVLLQFMITWDRGTTFLKKSPDAWLWLGRQTITFWSLLMLPLFITLETALLAGLEHSGDNWKHLFVLPIPRGAIYAAKTMAGMILIAISQLTLALYILLAGGILGALKPELKFTAPVPLNEILVYTALSYISSWLMISIHTFVGIRWKSFVVAMGFGIAMTVAGFLIINSRWANIYPWTFPGLIMNKYHQGEAILRQVLLGGPAALVPALLGGWIFTRRDVT